MILENNSNSEKDEMVAVLTTLKNDNGPVAVNVLIFALNLFTPFGALIAMRKNIMCVNILTHYYYTKLELCAKSNKL